MNENPRWFQLEPADAWFFRDSRPSNRGEDQSDLESVFPPYPTVVAGAFRAALARAQGWDGQSRWPNELNEVLGNGFEDLGSLSFTGPFLMRNGELLFPMPRHVLGYTTDNNGEKRFQPHALLAPSEQPVLCDQGEVRLPIPPRAADNSKPPEQAEEFFVTTAGMNRILQGQWPQSDHCLHKRCLFRHEPRIGIQRDSDTLATGENALYSPHYVRLRQGVSLAVGLAGLSGDWPVPGLFPLGGESRLATCHTLETPPPLPSNAAAGDKSLLILLAPARFNDPWWGAGPDDKASALDDCLHGTVVTAAIDRPVRIGGWDSLNKRPQPLEPYAPAGSVWWLENTNGASADDNAIRLGRRTAYGFGLAAVGAWPQ